MFVFTSVVTDEFLCLAHVYFTCRFRCQGGKVNE